MTIKLFRPNKHSFCLQVHRKLIKRALPNPVISIDRLQRYPDLVGHLGTQINFQKIPESFSFRGASVTSGQSQAVQPIRAIGSVRQFAVRTEVPDRQPYDPYTRKLDTQPSSLQCKRAVKGYTALFSFSGSSESLILSLIVRCTYSSRAQASPS